MRDASTHDLSTHDVSRGRIYVLRAAYLLVAAGLAAVIWPGVLHHPADLEHMRGVVRSLLAAVGLLAALGVRHPLRMLPVLFFELAWKSIWLLAFGVPRWAGPGLDAATRTTWNECLFGVALCVLVIPWGYVRARYLRRPADAGSGTAPATRVPAVSRGGVGRSPA